MNDYSYWKIAGHDLEYLDDVHIYLVDAVIVPSITQILKHKFGNKYSMIDRATLQRAAEKGTEMHKVIEDWCKDGTESDLKELRNFKFLKNKYHFEVLENEVPVILFVDEKPVAAGRLDLVIEDLDGDTGLADLKRTSNLDKEYLAYQLNLYRVAYRQSYDIEAEFLRGIHLRDDVRKYVDIPINEKMAMDLVYEFMEARNGKGKEKEE